MTIPTKLKSCCKCAGVGAMHNLTLPKAFAENFRQIIASATL
jgi:hypothetical protein